MRPDLTELRYRIYTAIEEMGSEESLTLLGQLAGKAPYYYRAHLEMEHSIPSPSSVATCRLQQWFKSTQAVPDRTIPAAWLKRSAAGVVLEPYWMAIMKVAGLDIELPQEPVPCGPHMKAHPDAYIGEEGLLELKDKTGWAYKRILEGQGIAYEDPREYMQAQLYLHATQRDWLLYFASPADPALLQSLMRQWKKYGRDYVLPLFYLELVEPREVDIQSGLARAEMLAADSESTLPPPREYDGREFDAKGNKSFPCGYCQYIDKCQELYR